jgi:hypothetical protein
MRQSGVLVVVSASYRPVVTILIHNFLFRRTTCTLSMVFADCLGQNGWILAKIKWRTSSMPSCCVTQGSQLVCFFRFVFAWFSRQRVSLYSQSICAGYSHMFRLCHSPGMAVASDLFTWSTLLYVFLSLSSCLATPHLGSLLHWTLPFCASGFCIGVAMNAHKVACPYVLYCCRGDWSSTLFPFIEIGS